MLEEVEKEERSIEGGFSNYSEGDLRTVFGNMYKH